MKTKSDTYPNRHRVIPVQFCLPPAVITQLDVVAKETAESRSTIVRLAVTEFLSQREQKEAA